MTQQVQINIDAPNRIVTITHRGALDLAPSAVELPFSAVKRLAASIIGAEGEAEAQQANARPGIVRPS